MWGLRKAGCRQACCDDSSMACPKLVNFTVKRYNLYVPAFYNKIMDSYSLSKFVLYLYFLFPALIILGIGSLLAIIAFIFEKIYANMCKSSKQFN